MNSESLVPKELYLWRKKFLKTYYSRFGISRVNINVGRRNEK